MGRCPAVLLAASSSADGVAELHSTYSDHEGESDGPSPRLLGIAPRSIEHPRAPDCRSHPRRDSACPLQWNVSTYRQRADRLERADRNIGTIDLSQPRYLRRSGAALHCRASRNSDAAPGSVPPNWSIEKSRRSDPMLARICSLPTALSPKMTRNDAAL